MYQSLNNNEQAGDIENDISNRDECCICFELDDRKMINTKDIRKLNKKCKCSAIVHVECINKWYKNKNTIKCIVCNSLIYNKGPARQTVSRPEPSSGEPIPYRVMCCVIIVAVLIVVCVGYPDIFNLDLTKNKDADANDPNYLLAMMMLPF